MNSLSNAVFSPVELSILQKKEKKMNHRKAPDHIKQEAARRVVENGESATEVAAGIGYSPSAVNNWANILRKTLEDESEMHQLRERNTELERDLANKNDEINRLEVRVEILEQTRTDLLKGIIERR